MTTVKEHNDKDPLSSTQSLCIVDDILYNWPNISACTKSTLVHLTVNLSCAEPTHRKHPRRMKFSFVVLLASALLTVVVRSFELQPGFIMTPVGPVPEECVHDLPTDSHIIEDEEGRSWIEHQGERTEIPGNSEISLPPPCLSSIVTLYFNFYRMCQEAPSTSTTRWQSCGP